MIKKHLLTCSVIIVLTIIFHLSFGNTETHRKPRNNPRNYAFISSENSPKNTLNFANEELPADRNVSGKMKRSLRQHSFRNVGSEVLHRKAEILFPIIEPILLEYGIPDDLILYHWLSQVLAKENRAAALMAPGSLWQVPRVLMA